MVTQEFRACDTCVGEENYQDGEDGVEICVCEDGVDEDGRMMVTTNSMRRIRREKWVENSGWLGDDIDQVLYGTEVLQEDLQDMSKPMLIIGTDVVNLYPSLDIKKVVANVREAVMETKITWQELDYLEGARYIALNWSSWGFPHVRLRPEEKRLLVATVIEIATEAMFQHHYYTFGGKQFQQMEGGPIGLRGTCTIARLVMQIFDRKWERLIKGAGVKLELYWRCMNDGRIGLHPIKRGWSWVDGTMQYCLRWEKEDEGRDLLEVTVEALRGSMRGVMNYLEFTFESGQDYEDGWLPTLDTNLRVGEQNIISYKYYEKPTTTNTTIRSTTAMAENPKMQCLSNDLVRRLLNTREQLPSIYRAEVVDAYGMKLHIDTSEEDPSQWD